MPFYAKPVWSERGHSANATDQVKESLALLAQEKVVMVPGGAFVMGSGPWNFHGANLPLVYELLDGAVYGRDSERRHFFASVLIDFDRGERSLGMFKYCLQNEFLSCEIGHGRTFAPSKLRVNYRFVPDTEYPSNEELTALLRGKAGPSSAGLSKKPSRDSAPLRALNERSDTDSPFGSFDELRRAADSPLYEGGASALKQAGEGERLSVEVVDLLIAAQQPALVKVLNGKRIELTGQVLGSDNGTFRLMRLLVLCCAADAQPLAVQVKTHQGPKPTPMTWVKVTGKVTFAKKGKAMVPVIAAESVVSVSQPDEPFLF